MLTLLLDSLILKDFAEITNNKEEQPSNKYIKTRQKISNKIHVSKTDHDAALPSKRGKSQSLKYKAYMSIDAQSRVIVDTKITTGACRDSQVCLARLEHIHETHGINISKAIADSTYGSGKIIQALIAKNIEPIISLFNSRRGSIVKEDDGFINEEENDVSDV